MRWPCHLLQSASRLVGNVLANQLNEFVEIVGSLGDLVKHLSCDIGAGLAEIGDDRVCPKLFPAVPIESHPSSRQINQFKPIVGHLVHLVCGALHASTSFLILDDESISRKP